LASLPKHVAEQAPIAYLGDAMGQEVVAWAEPENPVRVT